MFTVALGIPVFILGNANWLSHPESTLTSIVSAEIVVVSTVKQLSCTTFNCLNTGSSKMFVNSKLLCSVSKFVDILLILYSLLFKINLSAKSSLKIMFIGKYAFTLVSLFLASNTSLI